MKIPFHVPSSFFALALIGCATISHSKCHPSSDWLIQPDADTPVTFEGNAPPDLEAPDSSIYSKDAYPKTFSDAALAERARKGGAFPTETIVKFWEPAGENAWRVCRREFWRVPFTRSSKEGPPSPTPMAGVRYHKEVEPLSRTHEFGRIDQYFYDAQGRLSRISVGALWGRNQGPQDELCRQYDAANRITFALEPASGVCPSNGLASGKDRFRQVKYRPETTGVSRKDTAYDYVQYFDDAKKKWTGAGWFIYDNDPNAVVTFKAEEGQGISELNGVREAKLGNKDDNVSNTVADMVKVNREIGNVWTGSTYVFTQPGVPVSVLESRDELYKYERRRVTNIVGDATRMYELFKPNEHESRDRYYFNSGIMLRHEQFDEQGRIKRLITFMNYRQPFPGPTPTFNDDHLPPDPKVLKLVGRDIYHRVYDIDEQGRAKLVAMSWSDERRLNPLSKPKHIDFTEVIYGTPDGERVWKDREAFDAAFNTSRGAKPLFPDAARREKEAMQRDR